MHPLFNVVDGDFVQHPLPKAVDSNFKCAQQVLFDTFIL